MHARWIEEACRVFSVQMWRTGEETKQTREGREREREFQKAGGDQTLVKGALSLK